MNSDFSLKVRDVFTFAFDFTEPPIAMVLFEPVEVEDITQNMLKRMATHDFIDNLELKTERDDENDCTRVTLQPKGCDHD